MPALRPISISVANRPGRVPISLASRENAWNAAACAMRQGRGDADPAGERAVVDRVAVAVRAAIGTLGPPRRAVLAPHHLSPQLRAGGRRAFRRGLVLYPTNSLLPPRLESELPQSS